MWVRTYGLFSCVQVNGALEDKLEDVERTHTAVVASLNAQIEKLHEANQLLNAR